MNRSNMAKVLAAFVAGIVLTMGSLVYSRRQELSRFRRAAQTARSSAAPLRTQVSTSEGGRITSANPTQGRLIGPEDVKPSNRPVQKIKATSNRSVSTQVPGPAVPKATRSDRLRHNGSEAAQNTASARAPNTAPRTAAPASTGNDAWHTPPQTNSVTARAQQPSGAEATPERATRSVVTLQPGTSLTIRLEENVSTDRNRSGDTFRASLDSPLIVSGFVLAERGARVLGQIAKSKRARVLGSRADLSLRLMEIATADGQQVRIQTSPWEEKGAHTSIGDTPKMAAGAALGAVVGALTGAAKGAGFVSEDAGARKSTLLGANKRSLVLTMGARLTFRIATPTTITETLGHR